MGRFLSHLKNLAVRALSDIKLSAAPRVLNPIKYS